MKIVNLAQPTIVGEVLRYPIEGSLTVSDEEAERLHENNLLVDEPSEFVAMAEVPPDTSLTSLQSMSIEELMILVTKEGVPLHDATQAADIVNRIVAHRALKAVGAEYVSDSLHELELAKADKKQLLVIAAYEQADVAKGDRATVAELIKAIEAKRNAGS